MGCARATGITGLGLLLLGSCAEPKGGRSSQVADLQSDGATRARAFACQQWEAPATRIGAAAEPENATHLWSVTPYLVLLPRSGEGYVTIHVDAPRFDWFLYTTADVGVEALAAPELASGGAIAACPEHAPVEYGAYHEAVSAWPLRLTGEPGTRVQILAVPSPTPESDLDEAGHATHLLGEHSDAGVAGHDH